MQKIALFTFALSLVATSAFSQATTPTTVGRLTADMVGTNLVIFGPTVGLIGVFAAAAAAGGSTGSTTSTPSTN